MGGFFSSNADDANIQPRTNSNGATAPAINKNAKNVESGNVNTPKNNVAINIKNNVPKNNTARNNVVINIKNNKNKINRKNNTTQKNAAKNNVAINMPSNNVAIEVEDSDAESTATNDPTNKPSTPNSMAGGKRRKSRRGRKSRRYTKKH